MLSLVRLLSTCSSSCGRHVLPTSFKSVKLTPNNINDLVRKELQREESADAPPHVEDALLVTARKRRQFYKFLLTNVARTMAKEASIAERIRDRGLNLTKATLTKNKERIEVSFIVSNEKMESSDESVHSILSTLAEDIRSLLVKEHNFSQLPPITFIEDPDYIARPALDEEYSEIGRHLAEMEVSKEENVEKLKSSVLLMGKRTDSLGLDYRHILDSLWEDLDASRSCTELRTRRDPDAFPNVYPSYHTSVENNDNDKSFVVKFLAQRRRQGLSRDMKSTTETETI